MVVGIKFILKKSVAYFVCIQLVLSLQITIFGTSSFTLTTPAASLLELFLSLFIMLHILFYGDAAGVGFVSSGGFFLGVGVNCGDFNVGFSIVCTVTYLTYVFLAIRNEPF